MKVKLFNMMKIQLLINKVIMKMMNLNHKKRIQYIINNKLMSKMTEQYLDQK